MPLANTPQTHTDKKNHYISPKTKRKTILNKHGAALQNDVISGKTCLRVQVPRSRCDEIFLSECGEVIAVMDVALWTVQKFSDDTNTGYK